MKNAAVSVNPKVNRNPQKYIQIVMGGIKSFINIIIQFVIMPTFDITEKRPLINIFKLGGAYYFKHFFDDPGT
jgi:hypothetical protein